MVEGEPANVNGVTILFTAFPTGLGRGGDGTGTSSWPGQRSGIELLVSDCTVYTTKVLLTLVTPF